MNTHRKLVIGIFLVAIGLASSKLLLLKASDSTVNDASAPVNAEPAGTAQLPAGIQADPNPPIEIDQDPLYQAIRKQLSGGRESLANQASQGRLSESVVVHEPSSAQWQAIELMLRAARILEREEKRKAAPAENKPSIVIQSTVQRLRANVIEMIRAGMSEELEKRH